MTQVCQDLLVLQDKLGNRADNRRLRSREETRVIQGSQVLEVTLVFQDPLVPQVVRKERKENQGKQANEENQAKMVIPVIQDSLVQREMQDFQGLQAEMEREELKVIVDTQAHQGW